MNVKGITERITKQVEAELQKDILELFGPIQERFDRSHCNTVGIFRYVRIEDTDTHYLVVMNKLQHLLFERERTAKVNDALQEFVDKMSKDK